MREIGCLADRGKKRGASSFDREFNEKRGRKKKEKAEKKTSLPLHSDKPTKLEVNTSRSCKRKKIEEAKEILVAGEYGQEEGTERKKSRGETPRLRKKDR